MRTLRFADDSMPSQDAPRVFLCYKNTYARENYSPRRGPAPGRKGGRPPFARASLLGAARRNPACDVDKMPSPNFGSYRELNPSILCNPLSHKCFCSKETLEEHLAQDAAQVFLWIKNTQNPRVRFPVGTQKFGEGILSTSQAGLRRA